MRTSPANRQPILKELNSYAAAGNAGTTNAGMRPHLVVVFNCAPDDAEFDVALATGTVDYWLIAG